MAELLAILVPALGHALLHSLWQVALIGLVAALALHALRGARPQSRYAVACLALLACVLAPLATLLAQLAATAYQPIFVAPSSNAGVLPTDANLFSALAHATLQFDAFLPWIVALWAAGTCVMSLRMAVGLAWIRRLRHTPQPAAQAAWQARVDAMAARFGLRRGVALRLIDTLDSPVSAGWWRPAVLLPVALLNRMPTESIEALLAHELAHIRRHDYLVNLLQNAIEALLFHHPVTWWLSRRIRIEREQIADQLAADVTGAPRRLASALFELSELSARPRIRHAPTHAISHLAQAAHGGQLMSRIEHLVAPARRAQPGARIVFPLLGLAAACIASYAYAQIGKPDPAATPGDHAVQVSRAPGASSRDSFALVRKGGGDVTMWGPDDDMASLEAAKRAVGGDFLWFQRAGKAYVVTDPALFERARQAWRESDALGEQMETLGGKMEVHGKKMETLGQRMEQLTPKPELSAKTHQAMREMDALAGQQQALAQQQQALAEEQRTAARGDAPNAAAQRRLAEQMQALAVKQQALAEKQAHLHAQQEAEMQLETERFEAQARPMEALSREMELASKPMEALGKRMEVLGRKHEAAAEQAARELSGLISEALAKDLAKPVPARTPAQ